MKPPETMRAEVKKGWDAVSDRHQGQCPSAAGLRAEARVRDYMASTLEEALAVGVEAIAGLKKLFGQQIQVKPVRHRFLGFLDLEIQAATQKKKLIQGHARCRP